MKSQPNLFLVGEAKGAEEAKINSCFVGPSGIELLRMLNESGIISLTSFDRDYINRYYRESNPAMLDAVWNLHPEVYRTNVFQFHPLSNDLVTLCGPKEEAIAGYPKLLSNKGNSNAEWRGGYVRAEFEEELERLAGEIITGNPNVIVCLGNTALWALAGLTAITKHRGTTLVSTHTVLDYKLLPTYHPASILRNWENRPTLVADLIKARRESAFPEIRRPHREIWIEPNLGDIERFINEHIGVDCLLSVDIETSGSRITCIGFAPSERIALVIPFDDSRSKNGSYWETPQLEAKVWGLIRRVLSDGRVRKLFQNGLYDIAFLYRAYGIETINASEDTMLLHHALQPEALKGLGYLGSIYTDEGSWKHMRKKQETIKRDD